MVKHIYTDEETNQLIKDIREKEPSFNLSKFLKKSLMTKEQVGNKLDEDTILRNLQEAKQEYDKAKNNVEFWEAKHKQCLVQQELEMQEYKEYQKRMQDQKDKEEAKKENIKSAFKEIVDRDMTDDEYEEYITSQKSNIWSYANEIKEQVIV